ncbi:hypothetical protein ACJQWK_09194 [Exserohilum turcicum]|uniref:Alpha/beta hydrolase fold-3 domain-containing protein n=1 Tax=Exserohilum turcicum (strain 28A) TaxID=671987 RepID=R0K8D6_EXST2|nr:uncharacterized protein SETTUDRAFT_104952 [Exserohilum turcica Et28A]EOA89213.1 hypothetical protein SETTUDRAFT_104952 [Exserohilum turcica Et28A]
MTLDFSHYGGPSEKWLAMEKAVPMPSVDLTMDLSVIKATTNGLRDQGIAEEMKQYAPQVQIKDYVIPTRDGSTIDARAIRSVKLDASKKHPVYLYFHGGGFIFGTRNSDDPLSAQVAIKTACIALHVTYRHTPEHTFPTAWNDSQDAFVWLHKNMEELGGDPSKVIVAGLSAGGMLAASLALEQHLGNSDAIKGLPPLAGQALFIPSLAYPSTYNEGPGKLLKTSSYVENAHAPILDAATMQHLLELLKPGTVALKDTKLNVVNATAEDVRGMPPAMFAIAGMDPLRDEALLYAKTLAEANVPTDITLFKGVPHGHMMFKGLKATKNFEESAEKGIHWILSKPAATGKFEVKVSQT